MARLLDQGDGWQWEGELAEYDPSRGYSRVGWHLARAKAAPNKLVALQEIQMASTRPWLDDDGPEELGGVAFVLPPDVA